MRCSTWPGRSNRPATPRRCGRSTSHRQPQGFRSGRARRRALFGLRIIGRRLLPRAEGPPGGRGVAGQRDQHQLLLPAQGRGREHPGRCGSPVPSIRVVRLRPGIILKAGASCGIRRLFMGPLMPTSLVKPDPPEGSSDPTEEGMVGTIVRFTAGSESVDVTINVDSTATRDFLSLLPLTLTLEEFNDREKIADLPRSLDHAGSAGSDPEKWGSHLFRPVGQHRLLLQHRRHRLLRSNPPPGHLQRHRRRTRPLRGQRDHRRDRGRTHNERNHSWSAITSPNRSRS